MTRTARLALVLFASVALSGVAAGVWPQSQGPEGATRRIVLARVGDETITEAEVLWSMPADVRAGVQRAARSLVDLERRAVEQTFLDRYIHQETERRGITREALYREETAALREQFPAEVAAEALRIRRRIDEAKRSALEALIDKRLLEAAAKAAGLSVEQLLERQVRDRAGRPSQAELDAVVAYELRRQQNARPREEVAREVEAALRDARAEQRRTEYLGALRARMPVQVLLEPSAATRAAQ